MTYNPTIAHMMARASALAYLSRLEVSYRLDEWGYKLVEFFDVEGTQAYIAESDDAVIVAFRGTEPSKLKDLVADIKLRKIDVDGLRVHLGFHAALKQVSAQMAELMWNINTIDQKQLYMTGHSMGAALAALFSIRNYPCKPHVYLYGCPRVFGRRAAKEYNYILGGNTWRFVNHRDIVSRIPSPWWNYRHVGRMVYFASDGTRIHEPSMTRRVKEWFKNPNPFVRLADSLSDHSVDEYVRLSAELGFGRKVAAA